MAWLYEHPKSGNWYIGQRIHGKLIQRSTGTKDRKKAEAELAAVNALANASKSGRSLKALYEALTGSIEAKRTIQAEVADWLNDCANVTKVRPATLNRYKKSAERLLKQVGPDTALEDITTEDIQRLVQDFAKTRRASSANLLLSEFRNLFGRAEQAGRLRFNPASAVRPLKADGEIRRRPFTLEEVSTLVSKADPFWKYAVVCAFYTGFRLGDVATAPVGAFDLQEGVIRIKARKTQSRVVVPISDPLRQIVSARLSALGKLNPTDDLWPEQAETYRKAGPGPLSCEFHALLVKAGLVEARKYPVSGGKGRAARREIGPISFHSLRHSFVSLLKSTGSGQAIAKELAGHASDAVSDHYTTLPIETLREAVMRLPMLKP